MQLVLWPARAAHGRGRLGGAHQACVQCPQLEKELTVERDARGHGARRACARHPRPGGRGGGGRRSCSWSQGTGRSLPGQHNAHGRGRSLLGLSAAPAAGGGAHRDGEAPAAGGRRSPVPLATPGYKAELVGPARGLRPGSELAVAARCWGQQWRWGHAEHPALGGAGFFFYCFWKGSLGLLIS